jgi:hypothetical protein
MKRWSWLMAASLSCGVFLSPLQPSLADEQGWGLMLKSPHLGILYVYLTDNGFAIVYPKTGAKFVTHAPDWRVVMYNDSTKTYYVESWDEVKQYGKANKTKRQLSEAARKAASGSRKGGTAMIAGQPATQYFVSTVSAEGQKQAEAWITESIKPPLQLKQLLGKFFQTDMQSFPEGMPLKVKIADDAGKKDTYFETLKAEKQVIRSASFSYPPTYKRVDNELAVCVDEKSRKKMEDILNDSDELSSLLGPSSKSSSASTYHASTVAAPPKPYSALAPRYTAAPTKPPAQTNNNDWWYSLFGGRK